MTGSNRRCPGALADPGRRRVLGAGAAAIAAAGLPFASSRAQAEGSGFDQMADVVVVGAGAAGASAAWHARRAGLEVLVLEKAPAPGGTAAKSVGGIWVPANRFLVAAGIDDARADALRYMARLSWPQSYDPAHPRYGADAAGFELLAAYYDQAQRVFGGLESAGVLRLDNQFGPDLTMPDYYAHLPENAVPSGRALVPVTPDGQIGNGAELMRQFAAALAAARIPVQRRCRAERLLQDAGRAVTGLEYSDREGQRRRVGARRGVIFASGGFTHDADLCRQFLKGPVFGGCAVPTAEGDFVRIAQAAGAQLGNMSNAWWCQIPLDQALEHRSVPTGIWCSPGDSMLQVDARGARFMNEKFVYNERTQRQFAWDPVSGSYPQLLSFMVYDARCARQYAGFAPIPPEGAAAAHVYSGGTLRELAAALDARLREIAPHTGGAALAPDFAERLEATVARFNGFAAAGQDADFARGETPIEPFFHFFGPRREFDNPLPNPTLHPLASQGPYYAVILVPGTLDTKGGPRIDRHARVLDPWGEPIPGLYGAGNCIASPTGPAYWAGGATLGPAITFGALAARHAARRGV